MRGEDRQVTHFRVKDLMVTVHPHLDLELDDASTRGSRTSERDRICDLSLDILEHTPYAHIDPPYLHVLRVLLDHALARRTVVRPGGLGVRGARKWHAPNQIGRRGVTPAGLKPPTTSSAKIKRKSISNTRH